jgi:hypothetical protein
VPSEIDQDLRFEMLKSGFASTLSIALLMPLASVAETVSCKTTSLTVEVMDEALGETICTTAERGANMLRACHLGLPPDILVVVYDELPGVSSRCVGKYECDENRISIRSPEHLDSARDPTSAFFNVDQVAFFKSVLVHELAHAAFEHTACQSARCPNNHEYVAYVMQMQALPAAARQTIIDNYRVSSPVDPQLLNSFVAALAPDRFAAIAWQHFTEADHGCDFVGDLISGNETLQLLTE